MAFAQRDVSACVFHPASRAVRGQVWDAGSALPRPVCRTARPPAPQSDEAGAEQGQEGKPGGRGRAVVPETSTWASPPSGLPAAFAPRPLWSHFTSARGAQGTALGAGSGAGGFPAGRELTPHRALWCSENVLEGLPVMGLRTGHGVSREGVT